MSVAKGSITLSNINDALTVIASPSTCVIHCDYDGSNPVLTNAYTDITVQRGDVAEAFTLEFVSKTNNSITYTVTDIDTYKKRIRITGIPTDIISGGIEFSLTTTTTNYTTPLAFQFAVVRASTMLDWIQDWESNKTTIGSTYILTPKIFVGKKVETAADLEALCGVYIGPDSPSDNSAGLYGYHLGETIFQLDKNGGVIGGWGLTTKYLYSSHVLLDTEHQYIGVGKAAIDSSANSSAMAAIWAETYNHRSVIQNSGGVCMFYTSDSDYGMEGYLPAETVGGVLTPRPTFQLGHVNKIAGWNFDYEALWIGTKNNTVQAYTSASGSITLGTNGLRGVNWYIDNGGNVSFVSGLVSFASSNANIAGWVLQTGRLMSKYATLVADGDYNGLYLCPTNMDAVTNANLASHIAAYGGIMMKATSTSIDMKGYWGDEMVFHLSSSGNSKIAGWNFNEATIFTGTEAGTGFTASSGSITIGTNGIRGFKWRLESDGSGALAGGDISWDTNGIFLAGSIKVKDSNGVVKAGMSGAGTGASGIRFYAGLDANVTSPSSAPFRVDETGKVTATKGQIGAWIIGDSSVDNALISDNSAGNRITLSATQIKLRKDDISVCAVAEFMCGDWPADRTSSSYTTGSEIVISKETGIIQITGVGWNSNVPRAMMSHNGIFANRTGVIAYTDNNSNPRHYASIAAIARGNVSANTTINGDETLVAGVYGKVSNSGTAPAYGGYFENLKACGMTLQTYIVDDTSGSSTTLSNKITLVLDAHSSGTKDVILPNDGIIGKTVIVRKVGAGTLTIKAPTGQYVNSTGQTGESTSNTGLTYICVLYVDSSSNYIWSVK